MPRNYQRYIYVDAHPFLEWMRIQNSPQNRSEWSLTLIDSIRKQLKKQPEKLPINIIDDLACRMDHPEIVSILYGDV